MRFYDAELLVSLRAEASKVVAQRAARERVLTDVEGTLRGVRASVTTVEGGRNMARLTDTTGATAAANADVDAAVVGVRGSGARVVDRGGNGGATLRNPDAGDTTLVLEDVHDGANVVSRITAGTPSRPKTDAAGAAAMAVTVDTSGLRRAEKSGKHPTTPAMMQETAAGLEGKVRAAEVDLDLATCRGKGLQAMIDRLR